MTLSKNQKGFAQIFVFLLIVLVAIIGYSLIKAQKLPEKLTVKTPPPATTEYSKANPENIWNPKGYGSISGNGITLYAKMSGWGTKDGRQTVSVSVNIENPDPVGSSIKVSLADFSLLDSRGVKISSPTEALENKYIPAETTIVGMGQRLIGNISFLDIPEDFETGILRFQPSGQNIKPMDVPLKKPVLPKAM